MRTKYLRYLPLVILAIIPRLIWVYVFSEGRDMVGGFGEDISPFRIILFRLINVFSDWIAFFCIGLVFNKKKEALIGIAVHLFFLLTFALMQIRLPLFLLPLIISLAPYLVFGFLAFGPKRLWVWALMLIPIHLGSALEMGNELFNRDFNFFLSLGYHDFLGGEAYLEPLGYGFKLSFFLAPLIYYIFFAEVVLLLDQKITFNPRVIDLTMPYSRLGATFLFIFLRLSIYLSILGASSAIIEIVNPTRTSSNFWWMLEIQSFNLIYLLAALAALVAILWYYRRFLMEFLFERGERPSWGFWLLQVPFLEIIIFAFMVIFLKKRDGEDSYEVFRYHKKGSPNDVKIITVFMVIIQFLALVIIANNPGNKEQTGFIVLDKAFYTFIVAFYLINRKFIVGIFGWICINILFTFFGLVNDLQFDSRLMSFSILFVLIGLLHGREFSCISPHQEAYETDWEEDDLKVEPTN